MTLDERNEEVNQALESRFSQLNSTLEAHEAKLKGMMVPKSVWHMYKSYEDINEQAGHSAGQYRFYLGMVKLRGAWRLCHASQYEDYCGPQEEVDWKPIVEASIEDRIDAAAHIEKLREAIVEAKEKLVPELERAIAGLAKSLG